MEKKSKTTGTKSKLYYCHVVRQAVFYDILLNYHSYASRYLYTSDKQTMGYWMKSSIITSSVIRTLIGKLD